MPQDIAAPGAARARGLEPGDRIGDYVLRRKLGEGGMGEVYLAEQPEIEARVAIKVLSYALASSTEAVARLRQEAIAANRISHPNIVRIFNFGQLPDGRHYVVMEYLEGHSLAQRLDAVAGGVPLEDAIDILRQTANALDAAHSAGIVHRDIKPDNIFLIADETGTIRRVKLLDFGIARFDEGVLDDDALRARTATSVIMGSPDYMSPEQCLSQKPDGRSDVYSLGVVAFELFTGQLPFKADSAFEIMSLHVHGERPAASHVALRLPSSLDAPLRKALARAPEERFQTAGQLLDALERALARGMATQGPNPPWEAPSPRTTAPPRGPSGPTLVPPSPLNQTRAISAPDSFAPPVLPPPKRRETAAYRSPKKKASGPPWYVLPVSMLAWLAGTFALDALLYSLSDWLATAWPYGYRLAMDHPYLRRLLEAALALTLVRTVYFMLTENLEPPAEMYSEAICPSCRWKGSLARRRPQCPRCGTDVRLLE